jgi:hypothetical protein
MITKVVIATTFETEYRMVVGAILRGFSNDRTREGWFEWAFVINAERDGNDGLGKKTRMVCRLVANEIFHINSSFVAYSYNPHTLQSSTHAVSHPYFQSSLYLKSCVSSPSPSSSASPATFRRGGSRASTGTVGVPRVPIPIFVLCKARSKRIWDGPTARSVLFHYVPAFYTPPAFSNQKLLANVSLVNR